MKTSVKTFKFFGVCDNHYKLDDVVWQAIEDPSDGYRSYLGSIEAVENYHGIFFTEPLAEVRIETIDTDEFTGYNLVDVLNGHIWLVVGTEKYDSYYPCFVFHYEPRPSLPKWEEFIKG